MPIEFTLTTSLDSKGRTVHSAQRKNSNEPAFIVGTASKYLDTMLGLSNTGNSKDLAYNYPDYTGGNGFWAIFIYPTAMAESKGRFICLNTYDAAYFTFTFMQYAAHVAKGDFVDFFRRLLAFPNAKDYFPKLVLKDGRICFKNADGSLTQLEDDKSTQKLREYLNPTNTAVENQEIVCGARMVHWANNDAHHRALQVQTAVELYKRNQAAYDKQYGLDGAPAKVCMIVCDIRHQGRAKSTVIKAALDTKGDWAKAYTNLLAIGEVDYKNRISTLRTTIADLEGKGLLNKVWSRSKKDFVDSPTK